MPKRMIDTDLWNNEDIIEYFTAEDKYFWLYLLTNPHNNICGVMKASPVLIARDMGYSKECIQNLLYRFENVHKAIFVDKETHELLILNWGKFNWNKSPDILKTVEKTMDSVNSPYIRDLLYERIKIVWGNIEKKKQGVDRVSTGGGQDTITITSTNIVCNTDIIENTKRKTTIANEFDEEFEKVWAMYPRKVNKKLAKTAYIKSRKEGVPFETIRKGVEIYAESCKVNNTPECYIAHGSTWFNGHRWEDVYDENEPLDDMKGLNLGIML